MRGLAAITLTALAGIAGIAPAPPAGPADEPPVAERVVIIGAAGLRWDDLAAAQAPHLRALALRGSVGVLSVRSAPSVTCPSDGWLTLGSGTYAASYDPGRIVPAADCGARRLPLVHRQAGQARIPALAGIDRLNRELRFGARPGWLTRHLPCTTAVGDGAALAAAGPDGVVAHYAPTLPPPSDAAGLRALLGACPATLIDAGELPEAPGVTSADGARAEALRRLDDLVGRVDASASAGTVVMVLGVAETDARHPRLHVAMAAGPGFTSGYLASASTRRAPYVQLTDVAPTVLRALGRDVPDTVAGRPFAGGIDADARPAGAAGLDATVRQLADADTRSVEQRRVLGPFFGGLGVVVAVLCGALTAALSTRRSRPAGRWGGLARAVPVLRTVAVGLAAVPVATFLANLVPWWRTSTPLLAVSAATAAGAGLILALAVGMSHAVTRPTSGTRAVPVAALDFAGATAAGRGPAGRRVRIQLGVVAAVTLTVFFADAVTGASLQLDSLLGYNPVVAGRFVGFGNIAFSVLAAGTIVLTALLAEGRPRRGALIAVGAVAVPVLVVDGLPAWGADFGGVLTLVPTFTVLALLVSQARVTWRRVAVAQLAGVVVVGGLGWLDYLRPPDARSHFGRFVGTVVDGTAWHTIERKWLTSWELLFMGPHTMAALGLAIGLVYAVLRPPAALRRAYDAHEALRPMLLSTVALAAIGFATNDSGVAIPAVISLVSVPTTLALCATTTIPEEVTPITTSWQLGGARRG